MPASAFVCASARKNKPMATPEPNAVPAARMRTDRASPSSSSGTRCRLTSTIAMIASTIPRCADPGPLAKCDRCRNRHDDGTNSGDRRDDSHRCLSRARDRAGPRRRHRSYLLPRPISSRDELESKGAATATPIRARRSPDSCATATTTIVWARRAARPPRKSAAP